jgi:hypothetical protein
MGYNTSAPPYQSIGNQSNRIECAFLLAEKPQVHRKSTVNMTKVLSSDHELFCFVWSKILYFSQNFSYGMGSDINCTEVQRLQEEKELMSQKRRCEDFNRQIFIPSTEYSLRSPPLLLSFPGSGSDWIRRLVETMTGMLLLVSVRVIVHINHLSYDLIIQQVITLVHWILPMRI